MIPNPVGSLVFAGSIVGLAGLCFPAFGEVTLARRLPDGSIQRLPVVFDSSCTIPGSESEIVLEVPSLGSVVNPRIDDEPVTHIACDEWGRTAIIELAPLFSGADVRGSQAQCIYTAVAILPPANEWILAFEYDLSTWDSYSNQPGAGGYWDLFSVNINQVAPYHELLLAGLSDPLIDPPPGGAPVIADSGSLLPGLTWAFGGQLWGVYTNSPEDDDLEHVTGRVNLCFTPEDPEAVSYLSITLDTYAGTDDDASYPSWGTIRLGGLRADWNEDGLLNTEDILAYLRSFRLRDPMANLTTSDQAVNVQDLLMYLRIYREAAAG